LASDCKSIANSGDYVTGDLDGDDGLDNEIIIMDLGRLYQNAQDIVFILNSFKKLSGKSFCALCKSQFLNYCMDQRYEYGFMFCVKDG
jgi:stress response protein SCP2